MSHWNDTERQIETPSTHAGVKTHQVTLIFLCLFAISVTPIMLTPLPPLLDYPNYLALLHILATYSDSLTLQQYYEPDVTLNGNMGLVAGVAPLVYMLGPELGLKLFAVLTVFFMTSGVLMLHRTLHRQWSLVPFAVFLLVYNRVFLFGFLSFLFALGLAIWGIAGWIKGRELHWSLRATLGGSVALLLSFAHLFSYGVSLLVVLGFEFARIQRAGELWNIRAWTHALGAVLPLFAPIIVLASLGGLSSGVITWGSMFSRLKQWAGPFINYNLPLDVATLLVLGAVVTFLTLSRRLTVAWPLVGGLVLLAMLQLVIPNQVAGASTVDRRIPIAWYLLALAAIDLVNVTPRLKKALIGTMALVLALRLGVVALEWRSLSKDHQEYIEAFATMPMGAKLLGVTVAREDFTWVSKARGHIEAYAVVFRDAFVPSLFAWPMDNGQHLRYQVPFAKLVHASWRLSWDEHDEDRARVETARALTVARCYDYVLVNGPIGLDLLPAASYREVFRGEAFRLFRHEGEDVPTGHSDFCPSSE